MINHTVHLLVYIIQTNTMERRSEFGGFLFIDKSTGLYSGKTVIEIII